MRLRSCIITESRHIYTPSHNAIYFESRLGEFLRRATFPDLPRARPMRPVALVQHHEQYYQMSRFVDYTAKIFQFVILDSMSGTGAVSRGSGDELTCILVNFTVQWPL